MARGFETVRVEMPSNGFFTHVLECQGHDESHGAVFDFHWAPTNYGTDRWLMATASGDHSVRVFGLPSGKHIRTLFKQGGHVEWVTFCAVLNTGDILSAGLDGRVIRWPRGSARGMEVAQLGSIAAGAFCEKSQAVFVCGSHATICYFEHGNYLWQASVLPTVKSAPNLTTCCIGSKYLGVGGRDGGVFIVSKTDGSVIWKKKAFTQSVLASTSFQHFFVFGGADGRIIFIPTTGECATSGEYQTFDGNGRGRVTSFAQDEDLLFVGLSDGNILIYEQYEGTISHVDTLEVLDRMPILSLALRFVNRNYLIYCGHSDGTLTIWNHGEQALVLKMPISKGAINKLRINEEAQILVAAGDDAIVRILQMQ